MAFPHSVCEISTVPCGPRDTVVDGNSDEEGTENGLQPSGTASVGQRQTARRAPERRKDGFGRDHLPNYRVH